MHFGVPRKGWLVFNFVFYCLSVHVWISKSSPTISLADNQVLPPTWLNSEQNLSPIAALRRQQLLQYQPHALLSTTHLAGNEGLKFNVSRSLSRRNFVDPNIVYNNSISASKYTSVKDAHKSLYKIFVDLRPVYLAMALIPAFILCYGAFSSFIRSKLHLGEAMLAVTFGILLGPHVAGVFDPRSWNKGQDFAEVSLEVTRIIVALDVFSVGVELPPAYLLRHWRTMLCLLGPVMLAGWFIAGAFILIFVPSLTYLEALVISACICPTDILLATSVVGKGNYAKNHVPAHLRHLLQAEAGTNDGIAILFLYLAMFILLRSKDHSVGHAIGSWAILILLYHILLAIIMGAVIGFFARILLRFCKRRLLMDNESMVPMYISLALLTAGVCILAGTEDIVAAFACGTAFGWGGHLSEEIEASNFSEIVSHLVNIFAFIYVGATIPFKAWNDAILTLVPWKMVLLALAILLLRRLPIMLLLRRLMPELKTDREALFCAHFGPVGVSGLFISFLAVRKLPEPQIPAKSSLDVLALTIQPIVYLVIFFSVFIHGLSIPFFTVTKEIHSRASSIRRSGSVSSNNRPSFGQYRRSTSSYRQSTSQRPNGVIASDNQPRDVTSPRYSTTIYRSGALQFEELDPFQSTAVSPILPQVSAVSPFQSISIPQDAGLEAGTHSRQGIGSTNQ